MPEAADLEAERLKHARALELEMVKATATFEHAALKPPFLLNGGALAVLIALYSAKGAQGLDFALAKWAWISWLVGLGAVTLATFLGFASQFSFRRCRGQEVEAIEAKIAGNAEDSGRHRAEAERYGSHATRLRSIASAFVLVSLAAFAVGVVLAFNSLR